MDEGGASERQVASGGSKWWGERKAASGCDAGLGNITAAVIKRKRQLYVRSDLNQPPNKRRLI